MISSSMGYVAAGRFDLNYMLPKVLIPLFSAIQKNELACFDVSSTL